MPQIAKWNGHKFVVKPHEIRSFSDLVISVSSDVEDKKMDQEKFSALKNAGPYSITMTIVLDARMADYGGNVQSEAMALCEDARQGKSGYFYMGTSKLFAAQMLAQSAKVSNVNIAPNGAWMNCDVAMTFIQCSKADGTTVSKTPTGTGKGKNKKTLPKTGVDKIKDIISAGAAKKKAAQDLAAKVGVIAKPIGPTTDNPNPTGNDKVTAEDQTKYVLNKVDMGG